jgi:membrane protein YdbS with pleckstrin-like domain
METERKNFFEETRELATKYVDDRILLIKLQAAEKAAAFSSMLVKAILIGVIGFFIVAIISFLLGYYLSLWTDSVLIGFGVVVLIYVVLLFILLYAHKKYLHASLTDKVIELFFKKEEVSHE